MRCNHKTAIARPPDLHCIIKRNVLCTVLSQHTWRLMLVIYFVRIYFIRGALLPDPYPPNTGTLAIDDSLSGNTFGWFQGNDVTGSCEFVGGAYDINNHLCTNGYSNFGNFAYEIRMTFVNGNLGGIVFRASSTNQQAYYFLIGQNGS